MSSPVDRRTFLGGLLAAGVAACTGSDESSPTAPPSVPASSTATTPATLLTPSTVPATATTTAVADPARLPGVPRDLFTLGVASGDPLPDRVVLWTRLAPQPLDGGGMPDVEVPVRWQVADDEGFAAIVAEGIVTASPPSAHSLHVDASGLRPGREYFYRFTTAGEESPTGRTRTAPAPGSDPGRLRLLFASCQNWQDGYWTPWPHAVDEDPDLIVWLGDYIYEGAARPDAVRQHNGGEILTLDEYRNRWALYKGDPTLQAAHAVAPWIVTWDDHEVENNYAGLIPQDPVDEATFRRRRAMAYRAAWEHHPVRAPAPVGSSFQMYRSLPWGTLAELFVLDGRQHRSDQPCGGSSDVGEGCAERTDRNRTMLGSRQKEWLRRGVSRSDAGWSVLANQTIMTPVPFGPLFNLDQWDGYAAERDEVVELLRRARNAVVLTGDIHAGAVCTLGVDVDRDRPAGTEFVGTSISSGFADGLEQAVADLVEPLPQVEWFDATQRGYARCDVTAQQWRTDYRVVSTVAARDASVATAASWAVSEGTPGAEQA
ncbi:MAG: alkaline phosphatase D family protein [Actinomycetota bacterium]|nr:alkaline phosphatase D family protein [Actinomycetota bacterium]